MSDSGRGDQCHYILLAVHAFLFSSLCAKVCTIHVFRPSYDQRDFFTIKLQTTTDKLTGMFINTVRHVTGSTVDSSYRFISFAMEIRIISRLAPIYSCCSEGGYLCGLIKKVQICKIISDIRCLVPNKTAFQNEKCWCINFKSAVKQKYQQIRHRPLGTTDFI